MLSRRALLLPVFLFTLSGALVSSELSLEFGYSITTVLDFNKPLPLGGLDGSGIHPFALHPLTRAPNLLLLDNTNSAFFSLDLPLSQESRVRLLSGKGNAGFSDGDAISARFNRPRSFAVDSNDNVYVADRINHAIRKINGFSGMTTTIAGGYSKKAGHTDGPAQNATFSEDFDILFMHKMCSLLITDRGSRIIRQMDLKPEDCEEKQQSSKGLGAVPVSAIALVALLCGLALGFIARPFVTSSSTEASMNLCIPHLWNQTQITRTKPALMFCSGIRSVVASYRTLHLLCFRLFNFSLGYMHVVFRNIRLEKVFRGEEPVSLLDADSASSNHALKLQQFSDGWKDLIDFEEESSVLDLSCSANQKVETEEASGRNIHEAEDEGNLNGKIDRIMETNLLDFTTQIKKQSVVKRRISGVHDLSI